MTKALGAILIAFMAVVGTGCGTLTKEIHIELNKPVKVEKNTKSVSIITTKNATEVDLAIAESLANKLEIKGIDIIEDAQKADYAIVLSVPTKTKLIDEDGNMIPLAALSGGLFAAGVAYKTTGGSGSSSIGAGLAGAVGSTALAFIVKDSSMALKLDVVLAQNKLTPVVTQKTRIFSTVRQMHLDESEGRMVLVDKLSTEIATLF